MLEKLTGEVKEYLRIEDEDSTVLPLVEAAVQYLEQSTGILYDGVDALYTTAVKMLAAHWYDNRGVLAAASMEIPFSVEMLINHIKLCGDYREGDKSWQTKP